MSEACQVDFYVLGDSGPTPGQLACRLSLMAWEQGHRVCVVAGDERSAQALDDLMWDYPPARFLPHERDAGSPRIPVSIVLSAEQAESDRAVLINLGGRAVDDPSRFSRLLEIVPADERQRAASRDKFRHYRSLGLSPDHHEIS